MAHDRDDVPEGPDTRPAARGGAHPFDALATGPMRMPFPGERERNTLTYRLPGSMGGDPASPGSATTVSSMDAVTIAEHQKEGGGASSQRRPARKR